MKNILSYAISSVIIPLLIYPVVFSTGLALSRLDHGYVYYPVIIAHIAGILLSVVALARSNTDPIDISDRMRLAVLLGSIGIFLNIIGLEYILGNTVFHTMTFPPPEG